MKLHIFIRLSLGLMLACAASFLAEDTGGNQACDGASYSGRYVAHVVKEGTMSGVVVLNRSGSTVINMTPKMIAHLIQLSATDYAQARVESIAWCPSSDVLAFDVSWGQVGAVIIVDVRHWSLGNTAAYPLGTLALTAPQWLPSGMRLRVENATDTDLADYYIFDFDKGQAIHVMPIAAKQMMPADIDMCDESKGAASIISFVESTSKSGSLLVRDGTVKANCAECAHNLFYEGNQVLWLSRGEIPMGSGGTATIQPFSCFQIPVKYGDFTRLKTWWGGFVSYAYTRDGLVYDGGGFIGAKERNQLLETERRHSIDGKSISLGKTKVSASINQIGQECLIKVFATDERSGRSEHIETTSHEPYWSEGSGRYVQVWDNPKECLILIKYVDSSNRPCIDILTLLR